MKKNQKIISLLAIALFFSFTLASCVSAPYWYRHVPKSLTRFYGTGSAELQSVEKSRKIASMRAQEVIASQVQSTLQEIALDYYQENEKAVDRQTLAMVEQIARQVLNVQLKYTRIEKYETDKDGVSYALVSLRKADIRKAVREEERKLNKANKRAVALAKAEGKGKSKGSIQFDDKELSSSVANDTQQILNLYLSDLAKAGDRED